MKNKENESVGHLFYLAKVHVVENEIHCLHCGSLYEGQGKGGQSHDSFDSVHQAQ